MTAWAKKEPRSPDPVKRHESCVACGEKTQPLLLLVVAGNDLDICTDFVGCCRRFRLGMTPAQFQMYQRGVKAISSPR